MHSVQEESVSSAPFHSRSPKCESSLCSIRRHGFEAIDFVSRNLRQVHEELEQLLVLVRGDVADVLEEVAQ